MHISRITSIFVFTKSIKTLESIRALLKIGNVEDVLILLRTTFEGYLASRYIVDEFDKKLLKDFIFIPQQISKYKVIYENNVARDRDTKELIEYIQRNPSEMKLGKDKSYFYDFYAVLCNYAHCNYSIIPYYTDEDGMFTCDKKDNYYMIKILVFLYIRNCLKILLRLRVKNFIIKEKKKSVIN